MWLRNFCSRCLPWWKRHPKWQGTLSPEKCERPWQCAWTNRLLQWAATATDHTMPAQLLQAKPRLRRTELVSCFRDMHFNGPPFKVTNIPGQHTDFKKECSYFSENSKSKGWVYSFCKAIKGLSTKPVREGDQTSRTKMNLPSSSSHSGSKLFKENTWCFLVFQTLKNRF